MDLSVNRSRWRKRNPRNNSILLCISASLLLLASFVFFFSSSSHSKAFKPLLPSSATPDRKSLQCGSEALDGHRFLWYAPHSGFSNQLSELKNAILMAGILNRTLIVPPVLDHHAVVLGSCPKFRVLSPPELRVKVWDHIMDLVREGRYVSIADIVDLSSIAPSVVQIIDFRIFASAWCGLNMGSSCYGDLCCSITKHGSSLGSFKDCRSLLSGFQHGVNGCTYSLEEDCRTVVWTYRQNNDGALDSFQPDKELQRKKKISYVRRRRDVYKALGPGSKAETAAVLAFGSLFSGPYKGSELYIDIHEAPGDSRIQSLLEKIEYLPFTPEIIESGKEFAAKKIKEPFLCAQLRLLDGQFKNHWQATFSALETKLQSLKSDSSSSLHIFVMTDLPTANWSGTYLANLAENSNSYKLYTLDESDELIKQTAEKLMAAEHGLHSSFLLKILGAHGKEAVCDGVLLPDIRLYIEGTICSCAKLGFVGTAGSTIADSIELMRRNNACVRSHLT